MLLVPLLWLAIAVLVGTGGPAAAQDPPAAPAFPVAPGAEGPLDRAQALVAEGKLEEARGLLEQAEREAGGRDPAISVFLASVCNLQAASEAAIAASERAIVATGQGDRDSKWAMEARFQRGLAAMASLAETTDDKALFRQRLGMAIESFETVALSGSDRARDAHLRLASQFAVLAALPDTPEEESQAHFARVWALGWSFVDRMGGQARASGNEPDPATRAALTYLCGAGDCRPTPRLETGENGNDSAILDLRDGAHPEVARPRKLETPSPSYTEIANRAKARGAVLLRAVINTEGAVEQPRVVRGLPYGLSEEAADAVRQWRFVPAMRDGVAVPVYYYLTVDFRLTDDSPRDLE